MVLFMIYNCHELTQKWLTESEGKYTSSNMLKSLCLPHLVSQMPSISGLSLISQILKWLISHVLLKLFANIQKSAFLSFWLVKSYKQLLSICHNWYILEIYVHLISSAICINFWVRDATFNEIPFIFLSVKKIFIWKDMSKGHFHPGSL